MENGKCKIENDGVRFAQDLKSFPKEIPSFSTFNFQFSIRANGTLNGNLRRGRLLAAPTG